MKKYLKALLIAIIPAILTSCGSGTGKQDLAPNAHRVVAKEVIQTTRYTYIYVESDGSEYWVAINKADVKEGETYYWSAGSEMNNFSSRELKRTFPSIFFVQDFTDQPILASDKRATMGGGPGMQSPGGQQPVPRVGTSGIERYPGGITIAELYNGRESYSGKKIRIRGQVVKFSPSIMKRNWIHLQDGTGSGEEYDLTVTTSETASTGDTLAFEGTVSLNKDFGAGYFYAVILEDARILK